jgi:hypothetical protein
MNYKHSLHRLIVPIIVPSNYHLSFLYHDISQSHDIGRYIYVMLMRLDMQANEWYARRSLPTAVCVRICSFHY